VTSGLLAWGALVGVLVTGIGAIGAKVLQDFSRHDLELYCRRRNRQDTFDLILDHHEDATIAAESMLVVGCVVLILSIGQWFFPGGVARVSDAQHLATVAACAVVVLLVLTIWIPWAVVRVWSAPLLYHTWRFWSGVAWVLWPLTLGVKLVDVVVHRLAGQEESEEDEEEAFEDEIRTIVTAGLRDGHLEADAREMIEGVIELSDVDVSEIMTPRSEIDALDCQMAWPDILKFVVDVARTRIPVFEGNLDNVIGILFVKDLLAELSKDSQSPRISLRQLLRKPWFVPESKAVDDLLREFRRTRSHMAIVVDEYRAVAGVVTIEDALEEIVGEIADEADTEEEVDLIRVNDSTLEVDGRVHIDELNEDFGLMLPDAEEFDTIAGFVVNALGRIPKAGEVIVQESVRMTILKASPRRVERVRVEMLEDPEVS
jgi:CBS domain containing-hemolysin-like protein